MRSIEAVDIHITKVNDLRGACNPGKIPIAKCLASRKTGLVNIFNNDNRCLLWCIAAALTNKKGWSSFKASNPESYREYIDLISSGGVIFPVSISDISIIEEVNRKKQFPINFRINVFREDLSSKTIYLIRSSKFKDGKIINVLLVDLEFQNSVITHYVLIDSNSFFKKHYLNKATGNITSYSDNIFCANCFQQFWTKNMLIKHERICEKPGSLFIDFPSKEKNLTFSQTEYNFKRIYTGYADFESVLVKTEKKLDCAKCKELNKNSECYDCKHSFSVDTEIHKPLAVGLVIVDKYGELVKEYYYSGEKVVEKFVEEVLNVEKDLLNVTKLNKYMIISPEEEDEFRLAETCYICKNRKNGKYYPFSSKDHKCKDHDHITGV